MEIIIPQRLVEPINRQQEIVPDADYTQEQLNFIIKHELVHWFNPLVWMMWRRADLDMELSADDGVVAQARPDVRKAYTKAIYSTITEGRYNRLSTGFDGGKKILKKRFYNT